MGSYRKRYPVYASVHDDGEDDDFSPRRKKKGFIPWLTSDESDFILRVVTLAVGGAFTFFVFKLNERMSALEMKFAIFEVRHEVTAAQKPSVIDENLPEVWALPELGVVPNFMREYFGVRPLPMMNRNRRRKK